MQERSLRVVPDGPGEPATTMLFAETVRAVGAVARRGRLAVPVFRAPPRLAGVDRTIRRRGNGAVISVRLADRPAAAVQCDVIEGVVVANRLDSSRADRFRRAAWAALEGGPTAAGSTASPTTPATPDSAGVGTGAGTAA